MATYVIAGVVAAVIAVGSAYAMGALNPNVKGKLDNIFVSTSTYGISIPRGWGTSRYVGNLIWCSPINHTSSTGKGATNKTEQHKYITSFAYSFCAGPAEEMIRVWADGHLIYDATGTGTVEHNLAMNMQWYTGDETQLPDPTMEADKGVGQVPAYRGLVYLLCKNVDLNAFGGRLPNVSAEIAFKGATQASSSDMAPVVEPIYGSYSMSGMTIDWKRKLAYRSMLNLGGLFEAGASGFSVVNLSNMTETIEQTYDSVLGTESASLANAIATGDGQDVYVQFGPYGTFGSTKVYAYDKDGLTAQATYGVDSASYSANIAGVNAFGAETMVVVSVPLVSGGSADYLALASSRFGVLLLNGATLNYVWGAKYQTTDGGALLGDYLAPLYGAAVPDAYNVIVGGSKSVGSASLWWLSTGGNFAGTSGLIRIYVIDLHGGASYDGSIFSSVGITPRHVVDSVPGGVFDPSELSGSGGMEVIRAEYDTANDQLIVLLQSNTGVERIVAYRTDGTIAWNYLTTGGLVGPKSGQSRLTGSSFAWIGAADADNNNVFVIDTRTGTITRKVHADDVSSLRGLEYYDAADGWIVLNGTLTFGGMVMQKVNIGATGQPQALSAVVSDLCVQSGLAEDQFDVTELTDDVPGFTAQQETARKSIEQLAAAYFFDAVEHDDILTFRKRGRDISAAISYTDLKRVASGENSIKPVIQPELETPRRVTVRWPDPLKDYQQNATHVTRTQQPSSVATIASIGENVVDLRVTLARNDAKNVALRGLLQAWREREKFPELQVGPKFLALEPTDVVTLTTRSGDVVRVRLTRVEIGVNWAMKIGGTVEDERLWAVAANAVDGGDVMAPQPFASPYTVRAIVGTQMPLLRDIDDTGGSAMRSYTAAGTYDGNITGWRGSSIFIAPDDSTWATLSNDSQPMSYGTAMNALAAPVSPWLRDDANTLTVRMVEGADRLETATTEQVMNSANPAALINTRTGETEILQYTTVTPLGSNTFALTGLYRGRRGSDWACDTHVAGDIFLLLETDTLVPITRPLGDLSATRYVRATSPFQSIDSTSSQSVVWPGAAEKPYSPVQIAGTRDGSNNLSLAWVRRTRIGGEWVDGIESVTLAEATEAYAVDILDGAGAVVRTLSGLSSPAASYSAANQSSDGFTPGDPVHVRVYQLSSTVGRGYPGDATV